MDRDLLEATVKRLLKITETLVDEPLLQLDILDVVKEIMERLEDDIPDSDNARSSERSDHAKPN